MEELLETIYENKEEFLEAIILAVKEEDLCKSQDFFTNKEELCGHIAIHCWSNLYPIIDAYELGEDPIAEMKKTRRRIIADITKKINDIAVVDKAIESEGYWKFCGKEGE